MNNENRKRTSFKEILPRDRSTIIFMIVVAIVAFSLGGLMLNGGDPNNTSNNNDGHDHSATSESSEPTMWTCSMHPQIQLPKEGKCPLCFMDLIPVETGMGGGDLDPNQIRMSETAAKLAKIQTSTVTRAYAERSIRMLGKLDYDETKVAYITAWVPGRLDRLFIDYTGAEVKKGDHMVQMYSPDLIAAQEELLQAIKVVKSLRKASSAVLISTANETLKSSREKLRLYGLTELQIEEIEEGNDPWEHLTISAPSSGVVIHKDAKEGMYVKTGTRIYTIVDLTKLWVMLEAYESDIPWLKYGQNVKFTSPSFPGETFEAVISFINPIVNPKTRTIDIRAVVNNKDGRLKPEMFVSGTVQSKLDSEGNVIFPEFAGKWISPMHPEIVKDGPGTCDICGMDLVPAEKYGYSSGKQATDNAPLLIPATSPLITGKRAVVYIEIPDDDGIVFEGREITLGPRAHDYYVVKEGLEEGEKIVTNGAFKIDSELQLQAKPSMMSPKGGATMAGHQHGEPGTNQMAEMDAPKKYSFGTAERQDDCEEAQIALIPVYNAYLNIQMELANDNFEGAKEALQQLSNSVTDVDMSLFKDDAHTRWMKISDALNDAAKKGLSMESISGVRDAFYYLSLAAIELHDTFGHADGESYYLTYCPMARDNTGAYWLQKVKIVWNSFYGESMLRCGEIKQELHAGNVVTE